MPTGDGGPLIPQITTEEFERFFKAKNADTACPTCGHKAWNIPRQPAGEAWWSLVGVTEDGDVLTPTPSIPLAVLFCANCYTTRLHALLSIRNWLDENPAPPPEAAQ
jgi:hypothetical protein